jgi:hypothetical protein
VLSCVPVINVEVSCVKYFISQIKSMADISKTLLLIAGSLLGFHPNDGDRRILLNFRGILQYVTVPSLT